MRNPSIETILRYICSSVVSDNVERQKHINLLIIFFSDLNNHCNELVVLHMIVFQADFRECSAGFTGKSELSACDIITVSWRCIVVE